MWQRGAISIWRLQTHHHETTLWIDSRVRWPFFQTGTPIDSASSVINPKAELLFSCRQVTHRGSRRVRGCRFSLSIPTSGGQGARPAGLMLSTTSPGVAK
jgi:hypothetical protein